MPANVFARATRLKQLFKDERFLYPEFLPERLPHRDSQVDSLVFALQPVAKGAKPRNVFCFGKPGTGKTVVVKFVLGQLQEYSDRAKFLYLNCFEYDTRNSILAAIAGFLGAPVPRRGVAIDETYESLLSGLKKSDFYPLVILDEADQLLSSSEGHKLLYDLLRTVEFEKKGIGVVIISNNSDLLARLEARVKSSLNATDLEFAPYSPQQLKDILRERAEFAFVDRALDSEVINVAAAHAAKLGGDCRIAIDALLSAGREAEKENASMVKVEHLKKVFSKVDGVSIERKLSYLSKEELALLGVIAKNEGLLSGKLFEKYKAGVKKALSEKSFRTMVSKLDDMRVIMAVPVTEGLHGKSRKISLNVSKQALEKALKQPA